MKLALPRILAASVLMGAGLILAAPLLAAWLDASHLIWTRLAALAVLVGVGLAGYVLAVMALGVIDMRQIRVFLSRGRPADPAA
jgi:uncharacterized protein YybS (DUF2232 family)